MRTPRKKWHPCRTPPASPVHHAELHFATSTKKRLTREKKEIFLLSGKKPVWCTVAWYRTVYHGLSVHCSVPQDRHTTQYDGVHPPATFGDIRENMARILQSLRSLLPLLPPPILSFLPPLGTPSISFASLAIHATPGFSSSFSASIL